MNDEGFVVFVSVAFIITFSFVRSFVRCCSFVRARFREREREKEFKSENLSETSSISREWISRGKHNFFKTWFRFQTLSVVSRCFLSLSPPKALDIVPSVSFVLLLSTLDRSQTIRDNNTPPKKEGIAFKSLEV